MDQVAEFLRIAAGVKLGEWTSYGDISVAVVGTQRSARAVGRAAATISEFPQAHRVLTGEGRVSRGARSGETLRARRKLESEGIVFDEKGRADPSRRVFWDELQRRAGKVGRVHPRLGGD
jgi:alkylated DNA nucleotide flippase Atl1